MRVVQVGCGVTRQQRCWLLGDGAECDAGHTRGCSAAAVVL
jgi:hypothetical protein